MTKHLMFKDTSSNPLPQAGRASFPSADPVLAPRLCAG